LFKVYISNNYKLLFLFKNPGIQEKRPRLVARSKVPRKFKKIHIIFMMKINNVQTSILKTRINRSPIKDSYMIALPSFHFNFVVDCRSSMEVADKDGSIGAIVSLKVHDR